MTRYITKFIRLTHAVPFLQRREKDDRFEIVLIVLGGNLREQNPCQAHNKHILTGSARKDIEQSPLATFCANLC
jgi:hypothetical protein